MELKLKKRPMRPAWHFHSNYGSGTLSRGYTEYLMKHNGSVHEPILWIPGRKVKQVLKIRPKPVKKHTFGFRSLHTFKNQPKLKIKKRLKLRSRRGS